MGRRERAEKQLREMGLPGSGTDYERRVSAVLAMYDELQSNPLDHYRKSDFERLLENTNVGYDGGFEMLWFHWVLAYSREDAGTVLEALPGVERRGIAYVFTAVEMRGDAYVYTE